MDIHYRQREVELTRIIASLLKTPQPLLNTSARQALHQVTLLSDIAVLANGDVVSVANHDEHIAALCMALSQSERTSEAYRRRMDFSTAHSIDYVSSCRQPKRKLLFTKPVRLSLQS